MFTDMPPLSQRLDRLVSETPLVDPHTHIRLATPAAPDLAALLDYHWVRSELVSVGMNPADLDPAVPGYERVRRMLPHLKRMRNTAMSWCLRRILRDLHDFLEPELDERRLPELWDRAARAAADPDWPRHVLADRCNVRTFVTSLGNAHPDPEANAKPPVDAKFMLDAHYLFCPGVATDLEPFFKGRHRAEEYFQALAQLLPDAPLDTPERLERALRDWLERTVRGPVRFTNTFIPIETRFNPPDLADLRAPLARAAAGQTLPPDDTAKIVAFVVETLLAWHHDHRKALQIAVGAEYFICDGKSIPRFQESWTSDMARAFHRFPDARFDVMMASDVLTHELCVLARQFPNVHLAGYWWHNFFPSNIERIFALRVEMVPMTKFTGFLCDAYHAEWTYGKLQVVKQGLVRALVKLVESRHLDEDEVPALLRQVLHDTPRDLYDLAD